MEAFRQATQRQTLEYLGSKADEIAKIYDLERGQMLALFQHLDIFRIEVEL
jgi:hypothetical protein